MRVRCRHGHFIFEETKVGQISDFVSLTGMPIVAKDNYFTFEFLKEVPAYAIAGLTFLGFNPTKTFEGQPWEIFEQNNIVYDFTKNAMSLISVVKIRTTLSQAGNRYTSPGLIQPGSLVGTARVKGFNAWWSRDHAMNQWLYSEVDFV